MSPKSSPSTDNTQNSTRNSAANPTPTPTSRHPDYPLTATDALRHRAYVCAQWEEQQHLAQEQRMTDKLEKQRVLAEKQQAEAKRQADLHFKKMEVCRAKAVKLADLYEAEQSLQEMRRAVEAEKVRIEADLRVLRMELCRAKGERLCAAEEVKLGKLRMAGVEELRVQAEELEKQRMAEVEAKKQRTEAEWQADLRFLEVEMHRREAERLAELCEAEVEKQHLTGSEEWAEAAKVVDRRERQRKTKAEEQRVEREKQHLA